MVGPSDSVAQDRHGDGCSPGRRALDAQPRGRWPLRYPLAVGRAEAACRDPEARPTLTLEPDPLDGTPTDAGVPRATDTPASGGGAGGAPAGEDSAPGVGEAIGEARAAFMRMAGAHLALLRAELSLAGKELGIIIGLGAAALALAILIGLLLYIGSWLFFGERLFGSMGWGMIHGSLLNVAIIGFIGVNLAGGSTRSYGWGFVVGLITGVVVAVVLATNALPQGATTVAGEAQQSIDLSKNLLATLTGIVVGAAVLALAVLLVGWRQKLRGKRLAWVIVASALGGAFIGAIVASSLWSYAGLRPSASPSDC